MPANPDSTSLGPEIEVLSGFAFPSSGFHDAEGLPLVRIRDLGKSSTETKFNGRYPDRYVVADGDILVGMDGDFTAVRWSAGKALLNQRVCRISARAGGKLDEGYLFHLLPRELDEIHRRTPQTTVRHLSTKALHQICHKLPHLAEQRRIAEILDTLDEAILKTEQVIAKLQQMKQGLLSALLTRGIDENGELRDPERHPEQFKDSPLGLIPRGWEVRRLADVAEIRSGIAKNTNKAVTNPVWVHYLRVANVQDGFLDLSQMSKIRISSEDVQKYSIQDGDVLMNEGGDLDKLGRGGIWRGEYDPCVHQNHVFVVRCGPALLPEFLDAWTGSPVARRYFMVAGKQTTNLASINKTALGHLPVVVPLSTEQRVMVDALRLHEERSALEASGLVKLRALKQGLMDDLLTGRVRVPAESVVAEG